MNKKLITGIVFLILINIWLVSGASVDDYRPGWFKDYGGNQSNILHNFWASFWPFAYKEGVDPYDNADIYGWYNNTFFGLANWEREACLLNTGEEVRNIRDAIYDSILDESTVYTTTLSISATKEAGVNNTYLYEASWYVLPYGGDLYYKVYLMKDTDKEYFAGKKGDQDSSWELVEQYAGDSGYEAKYFEKDLEKAVLEYKDYGSDVINTLEVSIANKTAPD